MDLLLLILVSLTWLSVAVIRLAPRFRFRWLPLGAMAAVWLVSVAGWSTELRLQILGLGAPPPLEPQVNAGGDAPAPALAPLPGESFRLDLLAAPAARVEGLRDPAGPLPAWHLPRVRGATAPVVRLVVTPPAGTARLRLAFSARLHQRDRAGLELRWNGTVVRSLRLDAGGAWRDGVVDLEPRPGANVLEFRDTALRHEPDWAEYLERYPDVTRHLIVHNLPLERGAREHYELAGRVEGRTLHYLPELPPEPDTYRFLFRQLVLAGGPPP